MCSGNDGHTPRRRRSSAEPTRPRMHLPSPNRRGLSELVAKLSNRGATYADFTSYVSSIDRARPRTHLGRVETIRGSLGRGRRIYPTGSRTRFHLWVSCLSATKSASGGKAGSAEDAV